MHTVDMISYLGANDPAPPGDHSSWRVFVTYGALAQSVETAADNLSRAISDRRQAGRVSIENAASMLVASLGLMRAGFSVVPASKQLFEHLPQLGVSTLGAPARW